MPNVVFQDHYLVLGVDRNVTADDLKSAYRKLAREVHPDCLGSDATEAAIDSATKHFREVREAYEHLSDPELRAEIDDWLVRQDAYSFDFNRTTAQAPPITVPEPGVYVCNGITCRIVFRRSTWGNWLQATVTIQFADVFRHESLGALPHRALLKEVVAVDEHGDIVAQSSTLWGLQYNSWRAEAQAKRNQARRAWRAQLELIVQQITDLSRSRPVHVLRSLVAAAERSINSGTDDLRYADHPDTALKAIREVEKELQRTLQTDPSELLLADLLEGRLDHPHLNYNKELLQRLRVYAFRTNGEYTAPTDEQVVQYYQQCLAGLHSAFQVRQTNLKLPNDEPTILEFVQEGLWPLAPDVVQVQSRRLTDYPVAYGFAKLEAGVVPVGIIEVPQSVYERNDGQYGKPSTFPELPYGIALLVRVRVEAQGRTMLSEPRPAGKLLLNEVRRCQAQLKNPAVLESGITTAEFLQMLRW